MRMTALLLESSGYDGSVLSGTTRKEPFVEVNRALLETVHQMSTEEEKTSNLEDSYEIIDLLIARGGANPHMPVQRRPPSAQGDGIHIARESAAQEDTPLSAAARAAKPEAISYMLDSYRRRGGSCAQRRKDPLLRSQPESYFRLLEEKEDDVVSASVSAALVSSLFLLWQGKTSSLSYGRCALILYKRLSTFLSANSSRHLPQRALHWLANCISTRRLLPPPITKNDATEGYYFEAPLIRYRIPNIRAEGVDVTWSHVLARLPWFPASGVYCDWTRALPFHSLPRGLAEDEFYLVIGDERLLAHKSIVSAKSGKLAAQIRFTMANSDKGRAGNPLLVNVDLPLLVAKMLLCHCYHDSIAFGLPTLPLKHCHQLLELALVAEEYICPSLLLEIEMRLLMPTSSPACICPHCCGISPEEQPDCPIALKCLEKAKQNQYCEPAGVYSYKTSNFISSQGGLITPDSAIDVLAVAQQLDQSSSCRQELYALKYCRSGSIEDPKSTVTMPSFGGWNIDVIKSIGAGCIEVPFAAAKTTAIGKMLRDFSAVITSDSYSRQIKSDVDDNAVIEADNPFAEETQSGSEDATLLLQTCLEELARSALLI